jgi:hypothetical protein
MRHQKDAYNNNHIDIASLSIHAILRTPEYINAILMAEMLLNSTRNFRDCLLAHLSDLLTWDGRLSKDNAVRRIFFSDCLAGKTKRTLYNFTSSARKPGSET